MTEAPETLLLAEGLSRRYGELTAVHPLSLQLHRGEVLALLGPNGAGKSSTLQMLAGALAPSAGRVEVGGHDLASDPLKAKACIGYLPEQPPVYRELTVDEYLCYAARLRGVKRAALEAALATAKSRTGLTEVGHRLVGRLSKGYQQRVGIAQAIIHNPAVVILDEPTVGLDPIQQREIRALVRDLGQNHGVILSTHILPEVQAVCDRVVILHRGRVVLDTSMAELAASAARHLRLVCARPPRVVDIASLPGVVRVEAEGESRLIEVTAGFDAQTLLELAVSEHWGLQSFGPDRRSLEDLFVQLTCGEAA
jgi:ABC-2 type transport system ATP-binding protein